MEILIPLAKRCPLAEFHVVGGNEKQIQDCVEKSDNIKNLVFHGFKPQNELPKYIKSFDVVIAPYTNSIRVNEKKTRQ
jgi:glycosyltransferase involved in cell wall biosynthesis